MVHVTSDRPEPTAGPQSERSDTATDAPRSGTDAPTAGAGAPRAGAVRRSFAGAARGARAAGRGAGTAGQFAVAQTRRATRAEGAGDSGLSRLIELHAFNAAGDAAVAISLAGTLFFQVPTGEARGQVALFLGLTMLPFAIVAPLIGPFLDRFSHGRRWAVGATMAIRCFLCWVLATAVVTESDWLYPAALGCLVASKAYGVTRASAVPRLLPKEITLVTANSRISLAGVAGATIGAGIAAAFAAIGPQWSLRWAAVVYTIGLILAIRLPSAVDSPAGEEITGTAGRDARRRAITAAVVALGVAVFYGFVFLIALGLIAGLCSSLGKLSLDAMIQRDVPESVRTSVFARSETVLQLAWVIGGGCGIVMPLIPRLGFGFLAAVLVVVVFLVLRMRPAPRPTEGP